MPTPRSARSRLGLDRCRCAGALDEPAANQVGWLLRCIVRAIGADEANAEVGLTAIGARSPFYRTRFYRWDEKARLLNGMRYAPNDKTHSRCRQGDQP